MLTDQEKLIYSSLCTCTKRAIHRFKGHFGKPYDYRPRMSLCKRIAREQGLTLEGAKDALGQIRKKIKESNGEVVQ